jgi:hypothetical protein
MISSILNESQSCQILLFVLFVVMLLFCLYWTHLHHLSSSFSCLEILQILLILSKKRDAHTTTILTGRQTEKEFSDMIDTIT